jgi:hypothetical protein
MIKLINENKDCKNLIVFIHGFVGSSGTWIKDDGSMPFISHFMIDEKVRKGFDIGIFEYYTNLLSFFPKTKRLINFMTGNKNSRNLPIEEISTLLESKL